MDHAISLDPGSTTIKLCATGAEPFSYPSLVYQVETGTPGALGAHGAWWAVGEDAWGQQQWPQTDPHVGAEYHGSPEQYAVVCHGLQRLQPDRYATLVVGLPYFLRLGPQARAAAKRIEQAFAAFTWLQPDGRERTVTCERVLIAPQGGGALWAYEQQNPGTEALACAVDIGGHTSDIITAQCTGTLGRERIVPASSASRGVNVHDFYRALCGTLATLPGGNLSTAHWDYYSMMRHVIAKRYTLYTPEGRAVDIQAEVAACRVEFTRNVLAAARDIVGARWQQLGAIILTGGGAQLLDRTLLTDPRIVTYDTYANVRGQLLLASPQEYPIHERTSNRATHPAPPAADA